MRLVFLAGAFVAIAAAFVLADQGRVNESWAGFTLALLLLVCTLAYRKR